MAYLIFPRYHMWTTKCDCLVELQLEQHSKKKSTSEPLFWCSGLSQIEDSIQYLEGPNGIWEGHDRQIGVPSDVIWYFQVLNRVLYL